MTREQTNGVYAQMKHRRFGVALTLLSSWLLATGAAPSRTCTYTAGTTIESTCVGGNEDTIFTYLQGGVDTIATGVVNTTHILDGTVANIDISSTAAIAFSKLATLTSANILVGNGSNVATAVDPSGDVEISNTGATTVENNSVDGTDIAFGSDAQGDVAYYNGTDWARLGAGTSGFNLKTGGAAANPAWTGSNIVSFSRTALEGSGAQAVPGVGFKASAVFIDCVPTGLSDYESFGIADSGADEAMIGRDGNAVTTVTSTTTVIEVGDAGNEMTAVFTSMDADGFTVTWTKNGSGRDTSCVALAI